MDSRYSNAYVATQVNTSEGIDLVIALYEAALASLTRAMKAIEDDDDDAHSTAISRVSQIIMALSDALDYSQPGPLAGDLFGLYNYQLHQLLEAHRTKDAEPLQIVRSTLMSLLDGWRKVATITSAQPDDGGIAGGSARGRAKDKIAVRIDDVKVRRPSLRMTA